ncbi:MAG: tetratricopeptide repeat protein [Bacteroidales bacterium]|nr:tetratricopeptide repeat protein [Bacteroidales bacterium]
MKLYRLTLLTVSIIFWYLISTSHIVAQSLDLHQKHIIDSINQSIEVFDDFERLEKLFEQAGFFESHDIVLSEYYNQRVLELAKITDNSEIEIRTLINLGKIQLGKERYFDAMQYYRNALNLASDKDLKKLLVSVYNEIGITHFYLGAYDKALDNYFRSLKLADETNFIEGIVHAQNNIAIIYSINKDYENSLEYFKKSLILYNQNLDSTSMGTATSNIGLVYSSLNQLDSAIYYFNFSISIFKKNNDKRNIPSVYNNRAMVYLQQKNFEAAYNDLYLSLSISERDENQGGIISSMLGLGKYFNKRGQADSSLYYYQKCLPLLIVRDNYERLAECYDGLRDSYREIGQYEKALNYSDKYEQTINEINKVELHKKISELQIRFDEERKNKEIELLKVKRRNERVITWLLIAGVFVIAILTIYSYKVKHINLKQRTIILENEKKLNLLELEKKAAENMKLQADIVAHEEISRVEHLKFEEEIEHKNRSLSLSALQIVSKNEILQSIRRNIEKAAVGTNDELVSLLKQLIREIDTNVNMDDEWDNFKIHFEEVHTGFFARLQSMNDGLNANDLRLCAYIKIGLDTKEIARILNLSVNAIEKRRYRLRKKLGLEPEASISDYFNNI